VVLKCTALIDQAGLKVDEFVVQAQIDVAGIVPTDGTHAAN
jgi:hypothetical protein